MQFALVTLFIASACACELQGNPEQMNGCAFDTLAIVNPSTGFVITNENCRLEVDKETFFEQPFVFYSEAANFLRYTLIMVDRDNPLVADGNVYLHWLTTDIEGESLKYGLGIYTGNTVAAYVPPDPSQDSCVHRYSIFIYEQRFTPLEFPEIPESREDFNLQDFLDYVNPEGAVCGPVASIDFKSRY